MESKIKYSIEYKTIQMVINLLENSPRDIEKHTLGIDPRQLLTRPDA